MESANVDQQNSVEMCTSLVSINGDDDDIKVVEGENGRVQKDSRKWRCEYCSLHNPVHVEQCIACLGWKPSDVEYMTDEAEEEKQRVAEMKWKCRSCTLENKQQLTRCSMCETPRKDNAPKTLLRRLTEDPPPKEETGDSAEWTCDHCSFKCNPSWASYCDCCYSVRQIYRDQ
ncbi:hypothetical protein CAPTEDRAFT_191769, partial [Capitella teleta]